METTKTGKPKKEVSLTAAVICTMAACGCGNLVARLCNFFMDFTGPKADAFSAGCILAFGLIGFVIGVCLDRKFEFKVPNM